MALSWSFACEGASKIQEHREALKGLDVLLGLSARDAFAPLSCLLGAPSSQRCSGLIGINVPTQTSVTQCGTGGQIVASTLNLELVGLRAQHFVFCSADQRAQHTVCMMFQHCPLSQTSKGMLHMTLLVSERECTKRRWW
jgi:hypothetical protein